MKKLIKRYTGWCIFATGFVLALVLSYIEWVISFGMRAGMAMVDYGDSVWLANGGKPL